jgi:hypothetical protein
MANWYVYSGGGAASWGAWATDVSDSGPDNTQASLADVDSLTSAGDIIYVASDHAKVYAADTTITLPNNISVISVSRSTGARTQGWSETTSGSTYDLIIDHNESAYFYGLTLGHTGTSGFFKITSSSLYSRSEIEDCTLSSGGANEVKIETGSRGGLVRVVNTEIKVINRTSALRVAGLNSYSGAYDFINCIFSHPDDADTDWALFEPGAYGLNNVNVENSDLSAFQYISDDGRGIYQFWRCKIHSSVDVGANADSAELAACRLEFYDCSSGEVTKTLSQFTKSISYLGTCDYDGSNSRDSSVPNDGEESYSLKMTPSATYSHKYSPLELPCKLAIFCPAADSTTYKLTIYLASDDSGILDNELFAIVTSLDSNATSTAVGEFVSTRGNGASAGTSTYLKTGTFSEWDEGSGPSTAYQIEITGIAPAEPGYVYVRVFYGYTGAYSVWVDPAITLTAE